MVLTGWWLVAEVVTTFLLVGGFFTWVTFSLSRLRRSNHDIRNQVHKIAMMMEMEHGRSPLDE